MALLTSTGERWRLLLVAVPSTATDRWTDDYGVARPTATDRCDIDYYWLLLITVLLTAADCS